MSKLIMPEVLTKNIENDTLLYYHYPCSSTVDAKKFGNLTKVKPKHGQCLQVSSTIFLSLEASVVLNYPVSLILYSEGVVRDQLPSLLQSRQKSSEFFLNSEMPESVNRSSQLKLDTFSHKLETFISGFVCLFVTIQAYFFPEIPHWLKAKSCLLHHMACLKNRQLRFPSLWFNRSASSKHEYVREVTNQLVNMSLGLLIALVLIVFPGFFSRHTHSVYMYLNGTVLTQLIAWLTGSPVGLQMNKNLSSFMGTMCFSVIEWWVSLVVSSMTVMCASNIMMLLILFSGMLGASVLVAFLIDIISFAFFHVFFIYVGVSRLWSAALNAIRTMSLLFQGRKHNVLKMRIDNHSFELEELILGTVMLSVFVFLVPTVFIFFVSFSFCWIFVCFLQLVFWMFLFLFSEFPINQFSDALRGRHACGIRLDNLFSGNDDQMIVTLLRNNYSSGVSETLGQFTNLMNSKMPLKFLYILKSFVNGSGLVSMEYCQPIQQVSSSLQEQEQEIRSMARELINF